MSSRCIEVATSFSSDLVKWIENSWWSCLPYTYAEENSRLWFWYISTSLQGMHFISYLCLTIYISFTYLVVLSQGNGSSWSESSKWWEAIICGICWFQISWCYRDAKLYLPSETTVVMFWWPDKWKIAFSFKNISFNDQVSDEVLSLVIVQILRKKIHLIPQ